MRSYSKKCITCVWVQSNRDHKALSMCGDIMSMRKTMMKELRQMIEAKPVFRGKLKYPSINQSLNWQHKQCKDPPPNPVIKTLFVDHVCEPQENVPLPLPFENNLEDCLSLSLWTGNILQPSQATSNPLPTSSAELSQKFICNTR
ncbi:PREDICTED: protein TOPLESS-like isoform X2 [Prunus mume]|uniref:Protein TOPLESS-like isoform X2 n=1 Tax=Prunus mume TaxID=102107 RepID=A0ABM1LJA1_PRUMU|nr:PREDICTED: protein TOPLESS-like isoform X2 [Prunus mume]